MAAPWHCLVEMDADVALLQEAEAPPEDLAKEIEVDQGRWYTDGWTGWCRRTAIAKLSNRVKVEWIEAKSFAKADWGDLAVSRIGTLTAARVMVPGVDPLVVVSMYSFWESPHKSTGSSWIYSDASAHRLVSDLSLFVGRQSGHRILVAGDLNILYGYGDGGSKYWRNRYETVFDRLEAIGLSFVGPQAPHGLRANPWPDELPRESNNVPTYRTRKDSASASRQLDFVFASRGLADSVRVCAMNGPGEWGPSDHCRLEIEVT